MMRVQRCVGGGWYVLGPWSLAGTPYRLIVALGWFEVVVRRGRE